PMSTVRPDPEYALVASGNLKRRQATSNFFLSGTVAAAALAVLVLLILIFEVTRKGISALSWHFLTGSLPDATGQTGGIGPALLGTLELGVIATIIALPVGVLTAVALNEYAPPWLAKWLQIGLELMAGLPPILLGVF